LASGSIVAFAAASAWCTGWEEIDWSHSHRTQGTAFLQGDVSMRVCPDIRYYTVAPLQTSVGGSLELRVAASNDGGPVAIRWSGTGGEIDDPSAEETTYVCTAPGKQRITVTAFGVACERSQQIDVRCVAPTHRQ
jgi:hypothetical protein